MHMTGGFPLCTLRVILTNCRYCTILSDGTICDNYMHELLTNSLVKVNYHVSIFFYQDLLLWCYLCKRPCWPFGSAVFFLLFVCSMWFLYIALTGRSFLPFFFVILCS